jgi:hypothetical protein
MTNHTEIFSSPLHSVANQTGESPSNFTKTVRRMVRANLKQRKTDTPLHFRLPAWLAIALVLVGCAQTPKLYTMQPEGLEAIRSEISTIGVCISPEPPESEVMLPAKGVWGGLKRGIVVGASWPIMIGFASPIPGGTFLGVLVAPLGAVIGGIYGIFTAVPTEEIEHAEVVLAIASEQIKQHKLRDTFIKNVIDMGNTKTELTFVAWQEARLSTDTHNQASLHNPLKEKIDARLNIQVLKVGLQGSYTIDPPTDTFVQIHVELIRLKDDTILLDEHFTCASDEERTYQDWADQAGSDVVHEFRDCVPELAEKIIDDFFMVYPIRWSDDAHF